MNQDQIPLITEPESEAEVMPLTIIRTETVLSKLPIHHLMKHGDVDISIIKKDRRGDLKLKWEVTYAKRYGRPGPLAYKLDTLVINRRIDESGRPLPPFVCLGSLRDIARELNLGGNTARVKKALRQNAGAFITARLTYKTLNKSEKMLEADFSRYGVIFTGEKLPDGRRADSVYIVFNEPYREVLNNAPVRPLDYEYLKKLPPGPQRFYEIVSYRMFAAIKFRHSEAKLPYSEYCDFSAQQRYLDYEHFRKQMYKIHREHLKQGYLGKIRYEETQDEEGKPDWIMYYEPGPKARAEYRSFTGDKQQIVDSAPTLETTTQTTNLTPLRRQVSPHRQRRLPFKKSRLIDAESAPVSEPQSGLVAELTKRGIAERKAHQILNAIAEPELILDQLEWGDVQIARSRGEIRNPAGFYIHLIQQKVQPPLNFETSRRRKLREEAERQKNLQALERMRLEQAYAEHKEQVVNTYIREHLSADDFQKIVQKKTAESRRTYTKLPEPTIASIAERLARAEVANLVSIPSFEVFCERHPEAPQES